jgi:hypothetical protein
MEGVTANLEEFPPLHCSGKTFAEVSKTSQELDVAMTPIRCVVIGAAMSGPGDCFKILNLRRGPPIAHAPRRLRHPPKLTVLGGVDASRFAAAFSCAERRPAARFPPGPVGHFV